MEAFLLDPDNKNMLFKDNKIMTNTRSEESTYFNELNKLYYLVNAGDKNKEVQLELMIRIVMFMSKGIYTKISNNKTGVKWFLGITFFTSLFLL